MRITGLDLSLTSTGVARLVTGATGHAPVVHRIRPSEALGHEHERLAYLTQQIRSWVSGSDLVAIEGPSYGSVTPGQHDRAGLWWIIAHGLWRKGVPYVVISPSQVKMYATGNGGSRTGKDQVLAAVVRRYKDVEVSGNDEADALVLAVMCADHYGSPVAVVPQDHRRALDRVRWPEL